jgi:K+-transporting ATPase KdpF subunit
MSTAEGLMLAISLALLAYLGYALFRGERL